MAKKKNAAAIPVPVKTQGRICFGIAWFTSEADAKRYAEAHVGDTYNGGFFHGMPCGRDKGFDYVDPQHGKLFAVTTR